MAKYEERLINNIHGYPFVDFIFKRTAYSFTVEKDGEHTWYARPISKSDPYTELSDSWEMTAREYVPRCIIKRARELAPVFLIMVSEISNEQRT
jgi:hypothetical protein